MKDILLFSSKSIISKRINNFLDFVEDGELKILKSIQKESCLDPVLKKKLGFPQAIFPGKAPVEWWYFTGHLYSGKRKFGFEFSMFKFEPAAYRIGFLPLSALHNKPFLVLHSSITDITNNSFICFQDSGLIHDCSISSKSLDLSLNGSSLKFDKVFTIKSEKINLKLKPIKKLVKHFDDGFAVMSSNPESRTYYVTFSRLNAEGTIKLKDKNYKVNGLAWFDHQKSSVPHKSKLKGWDWFSIIFDDMTEIMLFSIKNENGYDLIHSGGSYIGKNSQVTNLASSDAVIKNISTWKSESTGITYPSGWLMEIPRLDLKMKIAPCMKNQEMDTLLTTPSSYWEGACDVEGIKSGKKIKGQSYVELVGYDDRLIAKIIEKSFL